MMAESRSSVSAIGDNRRAEIAAARAAVKMRRWGVD
jgi:hypothetical protein